MDPQILKKYSTVIAICAIADELGVSVRFLCGGKHLADQQVFYAMHAISLLSFADKSTFEDTAAIFGCGEAYASHNVRSVFVLKGQDREFIEQTKRISARAELLEKILKPVFELSETDRSFFLIIVDSMFEVFKTPVSDFMDIDFCSDEADIQRSTLVCLSQRFASQKTQDAIAKMLKLDVNAFHERSQSVTTKMSNEAEFKKDIDGTVELILAASSKK